MMAIRPSAEDKLTLIGTRRILSDVAIEQFDMDVLRPAQKGNSYAGPDGFRLDRELGAL